jgi:hypothetical protein
MYNRKHQQRNERSTTHKETQDMATATRTNRTGQTFPVDKKIAKAIEARTNYSMDRVVDWWKRMMMGWVEISGDKITFFHGRMDNAKASYTRNVW